MKALIIGGSGLVGTAAQTVFDNKYKICAPSSAELDIFTEDVLRHYDHFTPDLLIYAVSNELSAAPDNIGLPTEEDLLRAYHLEVRFPALLLNFFKSWHTKFFFFSTDMVFPADSQHFYNENDCPAATTPHASIKLWSEAVCLADARCYVLRLSKIFGPSTAKKRDLISNLAASWQKNQDLPLVSDIYKSYTYSMDVAREMLNMLQSGAPAGLYHVANSGAASMFDLFSAFNEVNPGRGALLAKKHSEMNFSKVPRSSLLTSIKRPALRPWHEAAAEYSHNYLTESLK